MVIYRGQRLKTQPPGKSDRMGPLIRRLQGEVCISCLLLPLFVSQGFIFMFMSQQATSAPPRDRGDAFGFFIVKCVSSCTTTFLGKITHGRKKKRKKPRNRYSRRNLCRNRLSGPPERTLLRFVGRRRHSQNMPLDYMGGTSPAPPKPNQRKTCASRVTVDYGSGIIRNKADGASPFFSMTPTFETDVTLIDMAWKCKSGLPR